MINPVTRAARAVMGLAPDRQRPERQRDESQHLTDPGLILGALPVPVVLLDADNCFRYVNHAAEQFLGVSAAQLASLRLVDLVPADNPLYLLIDQVRRSGATVSDHELTLDSPRLHKTAITVQGLPEAAHAEIAEVLRRHGGTDVAFAPSRLSLEQLFIRKIQEEPRP